MSYQINQKIIGLNPNDPEGLIDLEPEEGKENQEISQEILHQTKHLTCTENIQAMSSTS